MVYQRYSRLIAGRSAGISARPASVDACFTWTSKPNKGVGGDVGRHRVALRRSFLDDAEAIVRRDLPLWHSRKEIEE